MGEPKVVDECSLSFLSRVSRSAPPVRIPAQPGHARRHRRLTRPRPVSPPLAALTARPAVEQNFFNPPRPRPRPSRPSASLRESTAFRHGSTCYPPNPQELLDQVERQAYHQDARYIFPLLPAPSPSPSHARSIVTSRPLAKCPQRQRRTENATSDGETTPQVLIGRAQTSPGRAHARHSDGGEHRTGREVERETSRKGVSVDLD